MQAGAREPILKARGGEVLRVDELVAVAAVADDPDALAVLDELEQDGKEAEAALVDDGGTADRDDGQLQAKRCKDVPEW